MTAGALHRSPHCAILSHVLTQWEIEDPRQDMIGIDYTISRPVNGLLRPAVSSIRLRGVIFR